MLESEWFLTADIYNGKRTECSPVRSVIIRVINEIRGSPICLITSSSSSSSKFIKSPASGSSDLIYNNWKSHKNDL